MSTLLAVQHVTASVEGKQILKDVSLTVHEGEIHALMGPNGSGKSTFAHLLIGDQRFNIDGGDIIYEGESIVGAPPDERARRGMFLAFQHPPEIPGVTISEYLRLIYDARLGLTAKRTRAPAEKKRDTENTMKKQRGATVPLSPQAFRDLVQKKMSSMNIPPSFLDRSINQGFSGGERKKFEVLQLSLLEPRLIILDEVDSGLDVDALRAIGKSIMGERRANAAVLAITHYQRILDYVKPSYVHLMVGGTIVAHGGVELARKIEREGYTR